MSVSIATMGMFIPAVGGGGTIIRDIDSRQSHGGSESFKIPTIQVHNVFFELNRKVPNIQVTNRIMEKANEWSWFID